MAETTYKTETRTDGNGHPYDVQIPDTSGGSPTPPPASSDSLPRVGDAIPGTNLKYEQSDIDNLNNNKQDNAPIPRVTPPPGTAPVGSANAGITSPKPSPAEDYYNKIAPPPSQDDNYKKLLDQASGVIKSVNQKYDYELQQKRAGTAGVLAGAGLTGSTAAYSAEAGQEQPILDQRQADLEQVYKNIQDTSIALTQAEQAQFSKDFETAQGLKEKARTDASDAIKTMAASHLDWNAYKTNNADSYNALVKAIGGDPNVADAMFAMSIPAPEIGSTWNTSDGNGGTVVWQQRTDPITGNPSIVKFDMPGVPMPQNWTTEKFGTNASIFKSPNFNPNDPSTYMIVSSDPLNGGAITVTKDGVTTVNGVPLNSTPGTNSTSAVAGAAPAVASIIGLPDPTMPLSAVISDPSIGLEGIIAGIIKNEGGSPKGVVNNPGNIKFVGLPGQKDSGIKATDGGTFASYDTPQAGKQAIGNLVTKAAGTDSTFENFINSYTGTGSGTPSSSGSILSAAGISLPVFNYLTQGTASMSRMSAPQRNQIMAAATEFLNSKGLDVSTFQSQYKAYNDVLASNISRNAKVKIMENELSGTVDNLLKVADDNDLKNLNVSNVAKVWSGQQVNDPLATQYAFHFEQLKNELAGYFAASQGKSSPDVIDNQDAAHAVTNGMATGSLEGFKKSIENSTDKMAGVLQKSVDSAQKNVWDLFGVGDKFKGKDSTETAPKDSGEIKSLAESQGFDYQAAIDAGYSDEDIMAVLNK